MPTNKDGLDPTRPVSFEDHQRILREQREARKNASTESKARAAKTGRSRSKTTLGDSVDTQPAEETRAD